jgi:hypothetical protein
MLIGYQASLSKFHERASRRPRKVKPGNQA